MKKFEEYYTRFFQDVYNIALYYTKNEEEAKDLSQETWIKVFLNFSSFNQQKAFRPWAFKIVRNTFLSSKKIYKKNNELNNATVLPGLYSSTLGEENFLMAKETELKMKILKMQNELYFEIIIRRFFKSQSQKQIAEELGLPLGSVKSKIFHALELLRRIWGQPENKNASLKKY